RLDDGLPIWVESLVGGGVVMLQVAAARVARVVFAMGDEMLEFVRTLGPRPDVDGGGCLGGGVATRRGFGLGCALVRRRAFVDFVGCFATARHEGERGGKER